METAACRLEELVTRMGPRPLVGRRAAEARWASDFAELVRALGPRIGYLIRAYGLVDMREDAEQVCAIAVLRALDSYDPAKARFTTHVTWQMRSELQSLRHRVRLDQRQSARAAGVRTVSLEGLGAGVTGAETVFEIVDEDALLRTERSASDHMSGCFLAAMLDRLDAPEQERLIVIEHLFGDDGPAPPDRRTREQHRQIMRRTFRNCAKLLAA